MRKVLALGFLLFATLAYADGVNRAVRVAPGPGVTGDRFVGPCTDGYGVMGRGASLDPSCQGFVASGSGALTRTWTSKARDLVSALDFATGDGTTNDTTAIANAIAATPNGGTLFFPCGSYKVIGSSTAIFTRTTPIRIEGAGICSKIIVDSTVPGTRDLFLFLPAANYTGWAVRNLWITTNGGSSVAKNIINFDVTANDTVSANDITIEGLFITGAFNNYSIIMAGTALGASVFDVTIRNNRLDTGGIAFVNGGDSLRVEGNNISDTDTSRACVYSQQQAGAGNLYVTQNNMVCYSTGVTIAQGIAPVIMGNIAERVQAGTDSPLINITGASANVLGAQVVNNQLQVLGTRTAIPIFIATATGTIVSNNGRIAVPTGGVHISVTAAAAGTKIGEFNNFVTNSVAGTGTISDSGSGTLYGLSTGNLGYPFTVTTGPTVTVAQGALSLLGRSVNSAGVSSDISAVAGSDCAFRESGSVLGCGTLATGAFANNAITLAKLATQATNTVLGNATSGTAVPTALAVGTCSTAASALIWTTNTGFGCNTSITAAAIAVGGITGFGTGVATALAVNVGSAGAFVVNGGVLGTPSSGMLTNATGLPVGTGISGLGTGVATALGVNIGTAGSFIVNGGALGTPSSGTATNLTGLPLTTGVTGVLSIANGGTGDSGTAWTAYTPTITCVTGAPASSTAAGRYKTLGKTVFVSAVINSFSIGTCTVAMRISLPLTATTAASFPLAAFDNSSASGLSAVISLGDAGNVRIFTVAGAFPTGALPAVAGVYELP